MTARRRVDRGHRSVRRGRGILTLALALGALLVIVPSAAGRPGQRSRARPLATYTNPVFPLELPDPMVLRVGGDYYAYGTSTDWEPPGHRFPILHSTDLVHWAYVGDAFDAPVPWSASQYWAPSVLTAHGLYYLYYSALSTQLGVHCIAVAVSSSPTGPFVDEGPLGCGDNEGESFIDPAAMIAPDGSAYVYFTINDPFQDVAVMRLSPDLIQPAGPPIRLFGVSQAWEASPDYSTVEGPFPLFAGGRYYVFYSGNYFLGDYNMGVAGGPSPLGPFTKLGSNPLLGSDPPVDGPGGGSIFDVPGHGLWLAYHGRDAGQDGSAPRTLRIDPLRFVDGQPSVTVTVTPQPAPLAGTSLAGRRRGRRRHRLGGRPARLSRRPLRHRSWPR